MAEQQLFLTSGMNSWHAAEQGVDAEKGAHLSQVLVDCSKNSETFLIVKHQIIFFIGKHRCY